MMKLFKIFILLIATLTIFMACNPKKDCESKKDYVFVPEIDGDWWQVAGNPDLGEYTSERQQPVDFGIWQAKDGTWQIWSCIRSTNSPGWSRLLHGWEAENITDKMWKPLGIMMEADTTLGETLGGMQAPHVIVKDSIYHMLYGDWSRICLATSTDGKKFERVLNEEGNPSLFSGPWLNTRDAMTLKIDDLFYCYYVGNIKRENMDTAKVCAAIFCRTSKDLKQWNEPAMVAAGGMVGDIHDMKGGDAECPFVVPVEDKYVLFRNQLYVGRQLNTQYCSNDPLNFGVNDDSFMVNQMMIAAPEIVKVDNQYYIAALMPKLDGIRIAKLKFVKKEIVRKLE